MVSSIQPRFGSLKVYYNYGAQRKTEVSVSNQEPGVVNFNDDEITLEPQSPSARSLQSVEDGLSNLCAVGGQSAKEQAVSIAQKALPSLIQGLNLDNLGPREKALLIGMLQGSVQSSINTMLIPPSPANGQVSFRLSDPSIFKTPPLENEQIQGLLAKVNMASVSDIDTASDMEALWTLVAIINTPGHGHAPTRHQSLWNEKTAVRNRAARRLFELIFDPRTDRSQIESLGAKLRSNTYYGNEDAQKALAWAISLQLNQ